MQNPRQAAAGFSLPEILAVLAISGSMLLAFAGGGGSGLRLGRQNAAAAALTSAIDKARTHAIASATPTAFVVAGPAAGTGAWRTFAVFTLRESPVAGSPGTLAFLAEPGLAPLVPWTELPDAQLLFGALHGAPLVSLVDAPAWLPVPLANSSVLVPAKALVFNAEGALVYPEEKAHRVARVGQGEWQGERLVLPQPDLTGRAPAITIERFTGRLRTTP